jgi:hypothetical protein
MWMHGKVMFSCWIMWKHLGTHHLGPCEHHATHVKWRNVTHATSLSFHIKITYAWCHPSQRPLMWLKGH